jgi:Na+/H+ antiporter NhaD/arsenite permease-like protein
VALAIFAFSYFFIAGGRLPGLRLERTSGAIVGAVLMVAAGVVSPAELYAHGINWDTLVLLLGMMIITGHLAQAGFFSRASDLTLRACKTPRTLLIGLCAASALLSAFLVNDTVCLLFTPLALQVVLDAELPPLPYLLAVSMGANAGSVATLTGNPQNMIVGELSQLGYARFAAALALPALASTAITAGLLLWLFVDHLPRRTFEVKRAPPAVDAGLLRGCAVVLVGVLAGFFAGLPLAWTALGGAAVLLTLSRRDPRPVLAGVDYTLLLFFAALFAVVHGVDRAGVAAHFFEAVRPFLGSTLRTQVAGFTALTAVGSNLFSNVPFVLIAGKWVPGLLEPQTFWCLLALASTLAGNLTVVGSVANIIVLELARERVKVGFWQYLRYGVPVTLASLAASVALLLATRHAVGLGR